MPILGDKSMTHLMSCERDIQTIMQEAIKYYDFSVVYGKRTTEEQHELWKKGRTLRGTDFKRRDNWAVVDEDLIVTYKDGYEKKSNHQGEPKSSAVDIVPYPSMWSDKGKDIFKWYELSAVIKATQLRLLQDGKITQTLEWGYDLWTWDKPHWQIKTT